MPSGIATMSVFARWVIVVSLHEAAVPGRMKHPLNIGIRCQFVHFLFHLELVVGTVNVSHACFLHFFLERSVIIPTGGWVGLTGAVKIDKFVLPEHLHLCLHMDCLPGINAILSGHWRRIWSTWLKFDCMFSLAGNSRFLQTAQPSPAAFAACIPLPTQWPTLVSQVWQSPQSAWSAQSWPCSSISSHASTVLCVRVSPFYFSLPFLFCHITSLSGFISQGLSGCKAVHDLEQPQHDFSTVIVDGVSKAIRVRLRVIWAPADRQPRHKLTDAMGNSEGRPGASVVAGSAFFIKTSWEGFPLLWLLWLMCASDVLMAACSNISTSLLSH